MFPLRDERRVPTKKKIEKSHYEKHEQGKLLFLEFIGDHKPRSLIDTRAEIVKTDVHLTIDRYSNDQFALYVCV